MVQRYRLGGGDHFIRLQHYLYKKYKKRGRWLNTKIVLPPPLSDRLLVLQQLCIEGYRAI